MRHHLYHLHRMLVAACITFCSYVEAAEKPNIIIIFADDMGIGDVSHTTGKAPTPHIDRLAKEGMRFTDAHTTSSVCTPSRYSLLTGRYNWRTRLQKSVFFSPHNKPLIKPDEPTVASLLKTSGYHTACIGKWHLGIGWQFLPDFKRQAHQQGHGWDIDYTKPAVTPTSHGFDYFYGIQASLDMAPYVYIENDRAVKMPTVTKGFNRKGAATEDFEAIDCLKIFAEKSTAYITGQSKTDKPFFLYVPLTSPHTPIVPSKKWQGKSSIGKYGDFLMETDWVVGRILETLDQHKLTQNTLVIFTTDNGCSPAANIKKLTSQGHKPNGDLRGHKADIYEGGHRVPTLARWPEVIPPGTVTHRLTTLADIYATCADIIGAKPSPEHAVDSISFYPTLKDPKKTARSAIVMHSIKGAFAIRQGDWKLCFCPGSGGWSKGRPDGGHKWQLFNLKDDPSEKTNLYSKHPEKVKELHQLMLSYIENGRSTPGPKQPNDTNIILDKIKKTKNR